MPSTTTPFCTSCACALLAKSHLRARLEDIMLKVLGIMLFLYALRFLPLCLNVDLLCLTTRTNSATSLRVSLMIIVLQHNWGFYHYLQETVPKAVIKDKKDFLRCSRGWLNKHKSTLHIADRRPVASCLWVDCTWQGVFWLVPKEQVHVVNSVLSLCLQVQAALVELDPSEPSPLWSLMASDNYTDSWAAWTSRSRDEGLRMRLCVCLLQFIFMNFRIFALIIYARIIQCCASGINNGCALCINMAQCCASCINLAQ